MKMTFSNEITIEDPIPQILDYCKHNLVLINPDYEKKQRMGFWVGGTPRTLSLYRGNSKRVICPYGTFSDLLYICKQAGEKPCMVGEFARKHAVKYGGSVQLYDYQKTAVDMMVKKGYGILQSPAGSGKTQMGVGITLALGVKTLWLTHTHDLLKQSYDRFAQYIDKSLMGVITAGKVEIGEGITFATVQTLCKQDLNLLKNEWDCIIVDECHRCAGTPAAVTQFSKVLNGLAARHKFGLSATVHRADGLIRSTYAMLGKVAYIVPDEDVKDKVMQVTVQRINTGTVMPAEALDTDGTINFTKLVTGLTKDVRRNKLIASQIQSEPEHYHLILSDRIKHLHSIYDLLPENLKKQAAIIDGKMTSKKGRAEREQAIEDMRSGKKHILFASYKLAKEGLDIPRLDRLHLATPQKDYAVIVQSAGRIGRTFPDKDTPICCDYVDNIGMMEGMFKKRCTSYRKCGYLIRLNRK